MRNKNIAKIILLLVVSLMIAGGVRAQEPECDDPSDCQPYRCDGIGLWQNTGCDTGAGQCIYSWKEDCGEGYVCNPALGCVPVGELCKGVNCDDGNICTSDVCDPKTGECIYQCDLLQDGTNTGESCGSGTCSGNYVCDSNNPSNNCKTCSTEGNICGVYACPDSCYLKPDSNSDTYDYADDIAKRCDDGVCALEGSCEYEHYCADNDPYDEVPFVPVACTADCDQDEDCGTNACSETYYDYCMGTYLIDYNGDSLKNDFTVTDKCNNICDSYCSCEDCEPDCSVEPDKYCSRECGAELPNEDTCDDGIDNDCDGKIDCADVDCAGEGKCCQDEYDCAQDDCVIESCIENLCVYENRQAGDTTECETCEECNAIGGDCVDITADNGKNCEDDCDSCINGQCMDRAPCDGTECRGQEKCNDWGGDCADPDSNSYVCEQCYPAESFFDVFFDVYTTPQCCGDDEGEYPMRGYSPACCDDETNCVDNNGVCQDGTEGDNRDCEDGLDNDCDGAIDCEDPDCDKLPPNTIKWYEWPFKFEPTCLEKCEEDCEYDSECVDECVHNCPQWINSETLVYLDALDPSPCASGVDEVYYKNVLVDDKYCSEPDYCKTWVPSKPEDEGWILYEGPFQKEEESCHIIEYYSIDNWYNVEDVKWQCVFVDNTPPISVKEVGEPKIPCDVNDPTKCSYWVRDHVTKITLDCIDQEPHPVAQEKLCYRVSFENGYLTKNYCTFFGGVMNEDDWCCEYIGIEEGLDRNYELYFFEDSVHDLEYYCLDHLGNIGEPEIQFYRVDSTPPTTTKTYGKPYYTNDVSEWITSETPVTLKAVDGGEISAVGVDKIYWRNIRVDDEYCLNDMLCQEAEGSGDFIEYFGPFYKEESCHLIEYYSVDKLGNTEKVKKQCVFVDNIPPITTKEIIGPEYYDEVNDRMYIDGVTEIELTCVDPQPHPVNNVAIYYRYKVNDEEFNEWTKYTGQFGFPEESMHELEYYCIDALGNEEEHHFENYYVDKTPPITTKWYEGPNRIDPICLEGCEEDCEYDSECLDECTHNCPQWINSETLVHLDAEDQGEHPSGVQKTLYRNTLVPDVYCLDNLLCQEAQGTGDFIKYVEPFNKKEESCHLIEYYSVDNVEKTEMVKKQCVFVENTPPVSSKEVGEPKVRCSEWDYYYYEQPADGCYYITQDTEITLTCSDIEPHPSNDVKIYYRDYIPNGNCLGTPIKSCYEIGDQFGNYKCEETEGCYWVTSKYCKGTPEEDACENYDERQCKEISGCELVPIVDYEYCTGTPALNCYEIGKQFGQEKCLETPKCEWVVYGNQGQFAECNGDVAIDACEVYDKSQCESVSGCEWYIKYKDVCKGTPESCLEIKDEYKCEVETGCDWIVEEYCEGTPVTDACKAYDYFQCNRIDGCEWDGISPDFTEVDDEHITFTKPEDSVHILEWYCVDALGNKEETHYEIDIVDTQKPITTKTVGEPKVPGYDFDWWVTSNTEFELSCIDPQPHPVDNVAIWVKFKYDDKGWFGPFEYPPGETLKLPSIEGLYYLEYWCIDALGNIEDHQFETDIVDNTCPVISDIYPPDYIYVVDNIISFKLTDVGGIGLDGKGKPVGVNLEEIEVTGADGFDPITDCTTDDDGITYYCEFEDQNFDEGIHTIVVHAPDKLGNYCDGSSQFTREADVTIESEDDILAIHCPGCPPAGSCSEMPMSTIIYVRVCAEGGFTIPEGETITFDTTLGRFMPPIPGIEVVELGAEDIDLCRSAAITFDSGFTTGTAELTATTGSNSNSVDIELFTCALTSIEVSASPESIVADGISTTTITVQLKDSLGNNLFQKGTAIKLVTTAGTLADTTIYTNEQGAATTTLTSSASVVTATIIASVGTISDSVNVNFESPTFNNQIQLTQGKWKLISVPRPLIDERFNAIFEPDDLVQYYDAGWHLIHTGTTPPDDRIVPLYGYWAISQNDDTTVSLVYNNNPMVTPPQRQLIVGWNLIGYGDIQSRPIKIALSSIEGKYELVLKYDNGWKVYTPLGNSDFTTMDPGIGYWIFMKDSALLPGTV